MALVLRIENETRLPDGGPLSIRVAGRRGIDIGRDAHLDWTLPDPTRYISGKHCEVRWQDGAYVLYDVSTNGTYLNGSDRRLNGPHRLAHGDRLMIGNYIVAVEIEEEGASPRRGPPPPPERPLNTDFWSAKDAAPPVNAREIAPPDAHRPVRPDFLDWAVDVPRPERAGRRPADPPPPPPPPPPPGWGPEPLAVDPGPKPLDPMPPDTPRPVWVDSTSTGLWASGLSGFVPPRAEIARREAAAEPFVGLGTGLPDPDVAAPPGPVAVPPGSVAEPPRPAAPPPAKAAPPAPRPEPRRPAAPSPAAAGSAQDLLAALARGAGVPTEVFLQRPAEEVMEEIGAILGIAAAGVMSLLAARRDTKKAIRSGEHTSIVAERNNAMKFAPTVEDAMNIMFAARSRGYLGAEESFSQGFADLSNHQLRTFVAMQQALKQLLADLDPMAVEKAEEGGNFMFRKARLWDRYVALWEAKSQHNKDGIVGAFMLYFSEAYDRLGASGEHG
ncbi:type VI secretion system-associated FHA domain protein TagH [Prosthecomicrobium sp. N25]|uniref:type VI secretion system-associated FHA domain protein TagH n=1 Tax=Prosthecomicrobium sp. N25 TaxID=3129254 RepID=UPI003076BFE3